MFCWKCGDDNPENYNFCGACGAPARRREGEAADDSVTTGVGGVDEIDRLLKRIHDRQPRLSSLFKGLKCSFTRSHKFTQVHEAGGERIEYHDENGQAHAYRSVEEMPEEVRKRFEMVSDFFDRDMNNDDKDHKRMTSSMLSSASPVIEQQWRDVPTPIPFAQPAKKKSSLGPAIFFLIVVAALFWMIL